MYSSRWLVIAVFLIASILRIWKIDWGNGHFFHPDENNMAVAISQLSEDNLNPHFFAYGQFPLYLGYFTLKALNLHNTFQNSIFVLRTYSVLFSIFSVFFFYKISKYIAGKKAALIATILFSFTPGIVQLSHYGTTESLLILIFLIDIYLGFKIVDNPLSKRYYFWTALVTGIGLGSKISSLIFLGPMLLASLSNFIFNNHKLKTTFLAIYTILLSLIFFVITSPYNIVEQKDFLSALNYETQVASGSMQVFYTNQFLNTTPYLFQIQKIFPYVIGLFVFLLFPLGIFFSKKDKYLAILLLPSLVYLLYFGQLYVKWTRFMSPLFFIFPLFAAIFINRIKNNFIKYILISLCLFPGIQFMNLYLKPDIRVQASQWLIDNIPDNSTVLSEGGNVVDIPVFPHKLNVINFDFYNLEDNSESLGNLVSHLSRSDYILVPSRRVFKNQTNPKFPISHNYYENLFNGKMGFVEVNKFRPDTTLFLDGENAEETFTVFDQPTIRVYKKINPLLHEDYENILKS